MSGLQYEIHITEHGMDAVSVSLEWTKEAPKVAGLYFVKVDGETCGPVEWLLDDGNGNAYINWQVTGYEWDEPFKAHDVKRWLGPIPIPTA